MPCPPATHPRPGRLLLVAALALAVLVAAFPPGAARADSIAAKRAEAARVEHHLNELYAASETAIQRYDEAVGRLRAVRAKIAENTRRLEIARRNLRDSRAALGRLVVSTYKDGGGDVTAYVLGAGSFSDLVNRVEFAGRATASETDVVDRVAKAENEVRHRQAQLKRDEAKARTLVAQAAEHRRQVRALIGEQRTLLASIHRDIRRLIAERERARRLAALRRARAARRAAAEAARKAAAERAAQQQAQSAPAPSPAPAPASSTGGAPPPAGSLGQRAVQIAMGELGVPYVWGGASPGGFDCSGLTMWVYAQLGISLSHFTGSQWNEGIHVSRAQLQPGDLVFFEPTLGHVGIYIGNGSFIHAPHTGDVVKISSLSESWYSSEFQGGVRVTG